MGLFFFYNQKKPRGFNHKPIYFDPKKEELDKRIQKVKKEMGMEIDESEYKADLKGAFRNDLHHMQRKEDNPHKYSSSTNIRLAVILAGLLLLMYVLYFNN
ncbi:MAG: hypothetical protein ACRCXN_01725 [Bacteroidales bacterium]